MHQPVEVHKIMPSWRKSYWPTALSNSDSPRVAVSYRFFIFQQRIYDSVMSTVCSKHHSFCHKYFCEWQTIQCRNRPSTPSIEQRQIVGKDAYKTVSKADSGIAINAARLAVVCQ